MRYKMDVKVLKCCWFSTHDCYCHFMMLLLIWAMMFPFFSLFPSFLCSSCSLSLLSSIHVLNKCFFSFCIYWFIIKDTIQQEPNEGTHGWGGLREELKFDPRLSDFTFTFHLHALEMEMATHSSVLAWRIPGTAEPGGLLSMGLHRVRHDWSDLAAAASQL